MKINLTKSAGFCFGVQKAVEVAREACHAHPVVYMLGDIVHNEEVIRDLERRGAVKTDTLPADKNSVFLLRAHGTPDETVTMLHKKGYTIIDATCPMVKEIHHIVKKMDTQGYPILVIGERLHEEVIGICGQIKHKTYILEDEKDVKKLPPLSRAACVVQSTQDIKKVAQMEASLKKRIPDLRFFNTVCNATRVKQTEIRLLPRKNDVMLIIGSKRSANTKRLYEISRRLNRRTYWINTVKEIKKDWFRNASSVGITAGTSTPHGRIEKIIEYISQINRG